MTQLPTLLPERVETLRKRMSRALLAKNYEPIARGVFIAKTQTPEPDSKFRHDIISRARAYHLNNPNAVISHWAAAAYAGLHYWTSDAQVTLLVDHGTRLSANLQQPHRRKKTHHQALWQPDPMFPDLCCVTPAAATIQCLKEVLSGKHSWFVHDIPELTREETRAIQLIDAMRQCSDLTQEALATAGCGQISWQRLAKLASLSDAGAESPPETTLRLIARQVCPGLRTQIPIYLPDTEFPWERRLLTRLDSGWLEQKVGLFYDGAHHLERKQRDYDSLVTLQLQELGWDTMRITHGMLFDAKTLQRRIKNRIWKK